MSYMAPIFATLCLSLQFGVPGSSRVALRQSTEGAQRQITEDEAKALIFESLFPKQQKFPKLTFNLYQREDIDSKIYFVFEVTWDNPIGSVIVGNYGVNRLNCDVWNLTICKKTRTRKLITLQTFIRYKIGFSEKSIDPARWRDPCEK